jgi:hypothetical protein
MKMTSCGLAVVALIPSIDDLLDFQEVSNDIRKHYADFGEAPPPIPEDATTLVPCSLLVTETQELGTRKRIGRLRFFRPDFSSLLDRQWNIAGA